MIIRIGPELRRRLSLIACLALLAAVAWWGAGVTAQDIRAASSEPEVLRSVRVSDRRLALTFNVVWGHQVPAAVLDVLQRYQAQATFFVSGPWAQANPDLLRRLFASGQEIGSLGYRFMDVSRYGPTVIRDEILRGREAIRQVLGRAPAWYRPPVGEPSREILRQAKELGYHATVLWSLDSNDWSRPGVDYIVARVVGRASPGSIVLLHADDSLPDTARALPGIIEGLRHRGYRLVTVSQLKGGS